MFYKTLVTCFLIDVPSTFLLKLKQRSTKKKHKNAIMFGFSEVIFLILLFIICKIILSINFRTLFYHLQLLSLKLKMYFSMFVFSFETF